MPPAARPRTQHQVRAGENAGFQFKTHPNIDKAGYAESGRLGLKDPARPFPTGSELGVLKWRYVGRDEALVPLTISAWPSASGARRCRCAAAAARLRAAAQRCAL